MSISSEYFVKRLNAGTMRYEPTKGRIYCVPGKRVKKPQVPDHLRGNEYVKLYAFEDGQNYQCPAHVVVWEFFNGPIPVGLEVHHKDGIKHHNQISNLDVVTHSQNVTEGIRLRAKDRYRYSPTYQDIAASKFFESCKVVYQRLKHNRGGA